MKSALLPAAILLSSIAGPASAGASFSEVAELVEPSAFDDADDDWRRIVINRNSECGAYGDDGNRRIDVLIDRYNALADAVRAGDESGAMEAGKRFSAIVNANSRFEECWNVIARRVGVSSRLASKF